MIWFHLWAKLNIKSLHFRGFRLCYYCFPVVTTTVCFSYFSPQSLTCTVWNCLWWKSLALGPVFENTTRILCASHQDSCPRTFSLFTVQVLLQGSVFIPFTSEETGVRQSEKLPQDLSHGKCWWEFHLIPMTWLRRLFVGPPRKCHLFFCPLPRVFSGNWKGGQLILGAWLPFISSSSSSSPLTPDSVCWLLVRSENFTYIDVFNLTLKMPWLPLFYRWGNWGAGRLIDLLKVAR